MQVQSMFFERKASEKLNDPRLQENLKRLSSKFVNARANSILELEDFEGTRSAAVDIRNRNIRTLDVWLELFEQKAQETGARVLFARTPQEAAELVVKIAKKHQVKSVIKSKSMVTEEMALNKALEAADVKVRETDLGEYILQINDNERPSHIIAPVVHKDKEQVADLFEKHHHLPRKTDIAEMTREAREILRPQFLAADMGVTGGNFLIAETGSVALVTNEGNEGMCTINPRVHVAITGIEKVVPTLEDFATLIRLLPRSATGQSISNYVSLLTGPKRQGELDGPEHMYFVILDGGRTGLLGGEFEEMLRCIKCGACMNHCPVYQKIGGHAYGWVYPGPMGSVLTPSYTGIEKALDLPQAATLCGECHVVCPVKIPLPDLLRKLREQQFSRGLRPWQEKLVFKAWAFVAQRPALYRLMTRVGMKAMAWWGNRKGGIHSLPMARGWTDHRDFPVPSGSTFSTLYQQRKKSGSIDQ
jgi:L-lactate dehydrogenase complex protein LldF